MRPFASVCGIIAKGKKVLMVDLSYKNGLALPGGGVLPEESLENALGREVKEETNLEIKKFSYFSSCPATDNEVAQLISCFKLEIKDLEAMKSSDEGKPVWVNPKTAYKKAVYRNNKTFIKQYFKL